MPSVFFAGDMHGGGIADVQHDPMTVLFLRYTNKMHPEKTHGLSEAGVEVPGLGVGGLIPLTL